MSETGKQDVIHLTTTKTLKEDCSKVHRQITSVNSTSKVLQGKISLHNYAIRLGISNETTHYSKEQLDK
ncbi:hypothetical protein HanPI659440_Chr13g0490711 [Helianthus annuus]|nr:hypothetical protein HanPI659440_Chr13g0490711 [Helianthus annuus]